MKYLCRSSLMRSPTTASAGSAAASSSWAGLVSGVSEMNGRMLIVDQVSVSLLVTVPEIRTMPFSGIVEGVSWSMVSASGASSSARARLGAPAHHRLARRGALPLLAHLGLRGRVVARRTAPRVGVARPGEQPGHHDRDRQRRQGSTERDRRGMRRG